MTRQPCTVPGCVLGEHRPGHPHLEPRTHARTSDPATSHAAAAQLSDKASMLRALLLTFHTSNRTAEEAATTAGYGPADGAWKRISDLKNAGHIAPTGRTRPGVSGRAQQVYAITEQGQQALR